MVFIYLLSMLLSLGAATLSADSTPSTDVTEPSDNAETTNQANDKPTLSPDQIGQFKNQLEQWRTDHLKKMTPQQLQITANVAYVLFANTLCDLATRMYLPALVQCTQKIQAKLQGYQDATQEFALLKALTDKLDSINNNRHMTMLTLQEANNYVNDNEQKQLLEPVIPALQSLRSNGQELLRMHADNTKEDVNNYMITAAESLDNIIQTLHTATNMLKNPQELKNALPDILPNNEELAKIDVANRVAQGVANCGWENIMVAQNTMNHIVQLLRTAQLTYGSYYYEIYNYMKESSDEDTYQTQMFNEKGLIPAEYRSTLLPVPQEVAQQFSL